MVPGSSDIRRYLIGLLPCLLFLVSSPALAATRVLIMPVDFESYLLTAGGTRELQPEWTEAGTSNLHNAVNSVAAASYEIVDLPLLTEEEQEILDEHLALYAVAAENSVVMINNAGLKHKKENYDYTIGTGLTFLRAKTGAEKMIVFMGEQEKSSGGRIAMMVLGAAVGAATGYGLVPAIGGSYAVIGIVDLTSGNLDWVNYMQPMNKGDVREAEAAETTVRTLFNQYPGGKLMNARIAD